LPLILPPGKISSFLSLFSLAIKINESSYANIGKYWQIEKSSNIQIKKGTLSYTNKKPTTNTYFTPNEKITTESHNKILQQIATAKTHGK